MAHATTIQLAANTVGALSQQANNDSSCVICDPGNDLTNSLTIHILHILWRAMQSKAFTARRQLLPHRAQWPHACHNTKPPQPSPIITAKVSLCYCYH
jgi:hypothetical protein